jgi:hypothetical protein
LIDGQGINGRQTQSLIDGLREASQTDQPERGMEMQPERLTWFEMSGPKHNSYSALHLRALLVGHP